MNTLRRSNDGIIVCGVSHREEQRQHCSLRGMLGGRNSLRVDCRPQCRMPHQFLHHFEFGSDAPQKRGIGVSEGMPAYALLNIESHGDGSDVIAKDGCTPIRPPAVVQSTRKYPVVDPNEFAGLLRRRKQSEFPTFEVHITPLEPEQLACLNPVAAATSTRGLVRAVEGDPPTRPSGARIRWRHKSCWLWD